MVVGLNTINWFQVCYKPETRKCPAMKILLTISVLSLSSMAFSSEISSFNQVKTEISFDKGKKARRGKRANRKRKRRCQKAARRNFAG